MGAGSGGGGERMQKALLSSSVEWPQSGTIRHSDEEEEERRSTGDQRMTILLPEREDR